MERDEQLGSGDGPSQRVAAAAIRDAIDAMQDERPDLAERLRELLSQLQEGLTGGRPETGER